MPLPPADHKKPDITVHFDGIIPKNADRSPTPTGRMWKKEGDYYKLCYYNQTGYVIQFKINSSGTSIHISQSWPEWGDTLFVLMNPAMAAAISLQGYPILHGSSMVCNGNAFVISGISGAGKSSLTTALAAEGVALHSDDISVVDMDATMPRVAPGYPRLKIDTTLPQYLSLNDATLLPVVTTEADLSEKWISADELPGGFHPDSAVPFALKSVPNLMWAALSVLPTTAPFTDSNVFPKMTQPCLPDPFVKRFRIICNIIPKPTA